MIWKHVKYTRNPVEEYVITGYGIEEKTLTPVVIYTKFVAKGEPKGPLWTRPCVEFFDGRFMPEVVQQSEELDLEINTLQGPVKVPRTTEDRG